MVALRLAAALHFGAIVGSLVLRRTGEKRAFKMLALSIKRVPHAQIQQTTAVLHQLYLGWLVIGHILELKFDSTS
jgi:hypothetical protein